jgi:hypothetical protein
MKIQPFNEEETSLEDINKTYLKLPKTHQELILTAAKDYEIMNQQEKLICSRRNKWVRPIVEGAANAYGIEDEEGHIHLVMEDVEVVRTRRVSRTLNSVAAEELLKEKGIYDTCVQMVVTYEVDEDKIIEAYNAGKITAGELDSIFSEKISWATNINTDIEEVAELKRIRKEVDKSEMKELPTIECE